MSHSPADNSPVQQSIAFQFGARDAAAGKIRDPQTVFVGKKEQADYAAGVVSVTEKKADATAKAVVVPNYKANGRERVIRTASDAAKELKASATQSNRLAKMIEATNEFLGGIFGGDIIFAA